VTADFLAVNRGRLYEEVARQLVGAIVAGEIAEREFLPSEPQLVSQFAASRTVIREAVKVIVAKNLAEVERGVGTKVRPAAEWNIFDPDVIDALASNTAMVRRLLSDLLAIRWMVEPQIARAAAERAEPQDVETMHGCVEAMEGLVDQPAPFFEQDVRFHRTLLAASHNVVLERMFDPIQALLQLSKERVVAVTSTSSRRQSNRGHSAVLRAIERGDGTAAERELRHHLKLTARELELANRTIRDPEREGVRAEANQ
jgi:GntR family galactonate operon transcriptional repressor